MDQRNSLCSSIIAPMQLSDEEYFYKLDSMVSVSCDVLRKVFQARWKKEFGKDWKPTEQQGKEFIKGLGKDVYKKADSIQKAKIAIGCPEEWDICLLSLVLLNLGDHRSYKVENESVQRLLSLRNVLAHHPTRKITQQDYQGKMNVFRKNLIKLGVKDGEIEKMIVNAGVSCSDAAFKMAKRLYDKAKCKMAKNNFQKAIERCNEAVALPSLLPIHLSVAYENRAECYLKFAIFKREHHQKQESYRYIDQAIRDGENALHLNENSWKAHFVIGRSHRLNSNFELAIQHDSSALAISPIQKQVKTELDSCRTDFERHSSVDCFYPSLLPETLKERVAQHETRTGLKITQHKYMRNWNARMQVVGAAIPGADDLMRGDQYKAGLGVKPNDEEAAKYYSKAADIGNPEGMVKLGNCYLDGIGVPQDPAKAYKLFLKAANMSPDLLGSKVTAWEKNNGVVSAQFHMGTMYDYGFFVEKDYYAAAKWYRKAAENGDPFSANNLAFLYYKGLIGIDANEKMAELYFYQAVVFHDTYAAGALVDHYVYHMETEKALAMFKTAKHLGSINFKLRSEEEFKTELEPTVIQRNRTEHDVVEFEKEHNLDSKGLTVRERLWRKRRFVNKEPMLDRFIRFIETLQKTYENSETSADNTDVMCKNNSNLKLIGSMSKEGSVLATRILEIRNVSHHLIRLVDGKETFSAKQKLQVLNMLYDCTTFDEFDVSYFKNEILIKLNRLIRELYETKRGRQYEEEMKIRYVYVKLKYNTDVTRDSTFAVQLLKQGIHMHPNNMHYYELLCAHERDSEVSMPYIEEGLRKWPDNLTLLYLKTIILRRSLLSSCRSTCKNCRCPYKGVSSLKQKKEVVEAYEKFISKAPKDHSKLAKAYYSLAMIHAIISSDFKLMDCYYKLGKQAEEKRVPPYFIEYQIGDDLEKSFVETLRAERNSAQAVDVLPPTLERRMHLNCPVRRWMIIRHRQQVKDLCNKKNMLCSSLDLVFTPKLTPSYPDRMYLLKPITIKKMALYEDITYENRLLELTIIDVPIVGCCLGVGVHLIAEDEDGDVTHLNIFGMECNKENLEKLGIGARIDILHPHRETGSDPIMIRVDDPDSIIFLEKVENMCCFCAEAVAEEDVQKCGNCRKAVYCSKECQEHDWKIMKHKLICSNK